VAEITRLKLCYFDNLLSDFSSWGNIESFITFLSFPAPSLRYHPNRDCLTGDYIQKEKNIPLLSTPIILASELSITKLKEAFGLS